MPVRSGGGLRQHGVRLGRTSGQNCGDHTREHVARSSGRQASRPRSSCEHGGWGSHESRRSFQQDDSIELIRCTSHGLEPIGRRRAARELGELPVVRREDGRRCPLMQALGMVRECREAVGVDNQRYRTVGNEAGCLGQGGGVGADPRSDDGSVEAFDVRERGSGPFGGPEVARHRLGRSSDIGRSHAWRAHHHHAGARLLGGRAHEMSGAAHLGRACNDPHSPAPLVSRRLSGRQRGVGIGIGHEPRHRPAGVEPDRGELHLASDSRPGVQQQARLQRPEGHSQCRRPATVVLTGQRVDAGGDVDRQHGCCRCSIRTPRSAQPGSVRRVDDEVPCRRRGHLRACADW